MKNLSIVIISDTHGMHRCLNNYLPSADIIIHCGDMTNEGKEYEIRNFMSWYSSLNQYKYKICIAGNHDWLFETKNSFAKTLIPNNVIYLEDSGVEIEGYKFYGTPVTRPFGKFAFNRPEEKLAQIYSEIPDDTDILITHNPPYTIGDYIKKDYEHIGSPSLYKEIVNRIKPILSTFGHNHDGNGIKIIDDITFINASNLNDTYDCVYDPILINIVDNKIIFK